MPVPTEDPPHTRPASNYRPAILPVGREASIASPTAVAFAHDHGQFKSVGAAPSRRCGDRSRALSRRGGATTAVAFAHDHGQFEGVGAAPSRRCGDRSRALSRRGGAPTAVAFAHDHGKSEGVGAAPSRRCGDRSRALSRRIAPRRRSYKGSAIAARARLPHTDAANSGRERGDPIDPQQCESAPPPANAAPAFAPCQ
jgi:general stress protein YciG